MSSYYYYFENCYMKDRLYSKSSVCCNKSDYSIQLRVVVREENVGFLLSRLGVLLSSIGFLGGLSPIVDEMTNIKKDSFTGVEISCFLSGFRCFLFLRSVYFVLIPLYVSRYGYAPKWVDFNGEVKMFFSNPTCFFNYVSSEREDFSESVVLILRDW